MTAVRSVVVLLLLQEIRDRWPDLSANVFGTDRTQYHGVTTINNKSSVTIWVYSDCVCCSGCGPTVYFEDPCLVEATLEHVRRGLSL